MGSLAYCCKFQ